MFSSHHEKGQHGDDHKRIFHPSSKRGDVPPAVDSRTASEDDLLSLIDNFRFGPGAINSPNLRVASAKLPPPRKLSLSGGSKPPSAPSPPPGISTSPTDSTSIATIHKHKGGATTKNSAYDISADLHIRSKHPTPPIVSPPSPSPYANNNNHTHVSPYAQHPSPTPYNRVEGSLVLPNHSTTHRKKSISAEKGGVLSKRKSSPVKGIPPGRGIEEEGLEVIGQGPRTRGASVGSTHSGNGSGGGGGGGLGASGGSTGGKEGPINPLQELLQNRMTESEFANVIERQAPEMRWLSIRDLAAQLKRLITLLTFTTSISAELDLDKSSEKVAQHVCEILNADRASLYLIDEGRDILVSKSMALGKSGKAQSMGEIQVPMGVGIAGHVAVSGETLNIEDAHKDPIFWADVDKQTGYRTKTVLCMPVTDDEGRVVAVVEALNKRKPGAGSTHIEPFDQEDERVMKTLAHHAGLSLRNSQLYHTSQTAQRKIQVLLEVASQLASELETTSLITQIMTKARNLLDADRCTLFLLDAERGELWSKVAEGSKEIRVPATKGIAGHVATTGEILTIKDAYQDTRFNPEIDKRTGYRTKSILCMPLRNNKQEIIGVTQMINKKDGGIFEQQDEVLLTAFSAQAAVALENAKLFAKTNEMRNYLQSIIQSITNLVLSLDLEGRFLSSNHPTEKFLGVSEEEMRVGTYEEWLGEDNKILVDHISLVIKDPGKVIEKTDYELVLGGGRHGGVKTTMSMNYKVVPLVDTTNHVFQGVVVIIEDVTPQKKMMSTLNRYMSPALAEQVVKDGGDRLGGVHLTVSTLFADIRNFTPMSEGMDAAEVVGMLNEYFSYMVGVVFDEGGVLDKYIGDAMMAVFGVPFPAADDPHRACRAALEMLRRLQKFNEKRKAQGEPPISIGIGINTGKVLSGNIGSDKRLEYTVIGDGVNLASRIEGITKSYGVKVLLSEFTYHEVGTAFVTREVDAIRVVGKQQPVKVYELLGQTEADVDPALLKVIPFYQSALAAYRDRQFTTALGLFQMVAREAADSPSYIFIKRCEQMIKEPPGANWNGVYDFASK